MIEGFGDALSDWEINPPRISVIVPTFERPQTLRRCLATLIVQDFPAGSYEIIVVDDGSKGALSKEVQVVTEEARIRGMHRPRGVYVHYVRQENQGPSLARNSGARVAQSPYLAFIDDDCEAEEDWLKTFYAFLLLEPDTMVGGKTFNSLQLNSYSTACQMLVDFHYDYFPQWKRDKRFFTANNFAVSASRFHAIGRFETAFEWACEDRDFCLRWLESGRTLEFLPKAVVRHSHKMNLVTFYLRCFRSGEGAERFQALRERRGLKMLEPEPFGYYVDLWKWPFHPVRQLGLIRAFLMSYLLTSGEVTAGIGQWYARQMASKAVVTIKPKFGGKITPATARPAKAQTTPEVPSRIVVKSRKEPALRARRAKVVVRDKINGNIAER